MSYDILVFNPNVAPKKEEDFMNWWEKQSDWEGGQDYDDPKVTSLELKAFYQEMIQTFPAINGPDAIDLDNCTKEEEERATEYSIGENFIMMSFGWSQLEEACEAVINASIDNKVGFWDISTNEVIFFPNHKGELIPINAEKTNANKESYPIVYRSAIGWMLFLFIFTLSAIIGLGFAIAMNKMDPFALNPSLFFYLGIVLLVYATLDMYAWRLTIYQNGNLKTSRPFFTRTLHISEVDRQESSDSYIYLIPKDSSKKKLRISQYISNKEEFLEWVYDNNSEIINKEYEVIEKQIEEHDLELEEIFTDEDYGHNEEEIQNNLDQAKKVAKWSNRLAVAICLWALFYPYPFELSMIALALIPFIGISIKFRFKGLIRFSSGSELDEIESAYPSITTTIIAAPIVFLIRQLFSLRYLTDINYWPIFIIITATLSLLYLGASRKELKGSGLWILLYIPLTILVFSCYSYGFIGTFNTNFDQSTIELELSPVTSKQISEGGKRPDEYSLEVIPGKTLTESKLMQVTREYYEQINVGDTVYIGWQKGALKIPWYYILEIEEADGKSSID